MLVELSVARKLKCSNLMFIFIFDDLSIGSNNKVDNFKFTKPLMELDQLKETERI